MNADNASLQYAEEHLSCGRYVSDVKNGFVYKEFAAGDEFVETGGLDRNYLIMVIDGEVEICCNSYVNHIVKGGEMLVVGQTSMGKLSVLRDSKIMFWGFEAFVSSCSKFDINYLYKCSVDIDYNMDTLPICRPLEMFIDLMRFYLVNKVSCGHLHKDKGNELTIILRCFYRKDELAHLLYPILNEDHDFKLFIFKNYKEVKSATDLIALSCMSRSVFYERFKKAFHVSIKQWLVKQKLYSIEYKASDPACDITTLVNEFGFSSMSRFQSFCKQYWGLTPSELIASCKAGKIPECIVPLE